MLIVIFEILIGTFAYLKMKSKAFIAGFIALEFASVVYCAFDQIHKFGFDRVSFFPTSLIGWGIALLLMIFIFFVCLKY